VRPARREGDRPGRQGTPGWLQDGPAWSEDPPAGPAPVDPSGPQRAGLATGALLPSPPETASRGWRKFVYQVSGGSLNPGPSPEETRQRRLTARIRTPLEDCHRIAVMSIKGGVGKTTTTIALGSTLASLRGDRVVAIDANPDRGTLGAKVPRTSAHTVRELLEDAPRLHRYVDVRRYLSQADSRLEVLASANDPEISEAFKDSDYRAVDNLLQVHYSILLTDCGTGILHSAMHGVLALADTLVIVSSSSADGGASGSATLDWLEAHGYAEQVRQAVAVISMFPQHVQTVDVDALEQHFAARTRQVVRVPYDPHLATGGRIVLDEMKRETQRAYQEIAGAVAERFGQERGPQPTY
jgi:MinD-like ATPase involved in chromosome partitioning or flagellar assembly